MAVGHPEYLDLDAVGFERMTRSGWQKAVAFLLLGTLTIGASYILYLVSSKLIQWYRARRRVPRVPSAVSNHLNKLAKQAENSPARVSPVDSTALRLKSFGVYLGSLGNLSAAQQGELLSLWDAVVLDPFADGVTSAVAALDQKPSQVLGRVAVSSVAGSEKSKSVKEVNTTIDRFLEIIHKLLPREKQQCFTGVVIAESAAHFQPDVLNRVVQITKVLGLEVWLELEFPHYLSASDCRTINFHNIRGVIYRNGTIRTDGLQQNVHQMDALRETQRGIARQKVVHGPAMALMETIDNDAKVDYAVCQRSFAWCRYNSALPWIGRSSALVDAESATSQSVLRPPLGALMWLKDELNMKAHDVWRSNEKISKRSSGGHNELYRSLEDFVPDLSTKLQLLPTSARHSGQKSRPHTLISFKSYDYENSPERIDPLSISSTGNNFTGLGCFQTGLEASQTDFIDLLAAQHGLKDLNLLRNLDADERTDLSEQLQKLTSGRLDLDIGPQAWSAIKDLRELLQIEGSPSQLQVYIGLHSGFQTGSRSQFWGLYDHDDTTGAMTIFVSKFTADIAGTILHTYLSSRGVIRSECLLAEAAMARASGSMNETWQLPARVVQDVEKLSPQELLLFVGRLSQSKHLELANSLRFCCEYQLMERPTLGQLRELGSNEYLDGNISGADLVNARINWLHDKRVWCPSSDAAVSLFAEVEARLYDVLMTGKSEIYARISSVIQTICTTDKIDAGADIFALAVFKAFQKFALDEVYLEVMDRNVFPNHATDQAGCFAENFALGSRCESFFDATPRVIGTILSNRARAYYKVHQPPRRSDLITELPTAYAAMQVDDDPDDGLEGTPFHYKLTFLGIFAVPALIDITLLTTIGRGLYLTTFMTSNEKTTATTALLFALLTCGAVGGWISSGGSYYLFANAFPAMNMFVLTRFVAGVAVVILGGSTGFVVFSIMDNNVISGLIFFFYFGMLAIYLMILAALSVYQVPGSSFLSGRTVVMSRIPILFISPILTIWIQHDIIVYVCVLTFFLFALLVGARNVMAEWTTWYLNIPSITDAEITKWYLETSGTKMTAEEASMSPAPREALVSAVFAEKKRPFWKKATKDAFVLKLAIGFDSTKFLMSWYCKFKRSRMPLAYSSTWNLTLKAGLESMTNMQKGLKLHSAFLHWRHTGSDIWSAILYFVVALTDKWAALFSGGNLVGLSAASSVQFRLAVGFGLCYYLIGAVSLDTVSQPLWTAANEQTVQPITSLDFLRDATENDKAARRRLYFRNLWKFFCLHIWGIVITSAMLWTFSDYRGATIMYLCYLGAYTGLLWYQYNKIYCGFDSAKALKVAAVIGLPVGIALHVKLPTMPYSGVISLAIATWIACAYSIWLSNIGWLNFFYNPTKKGYSLLHGADDDQCVVTYYSGTNASDEAESRKTLLDMYKQASALGSDRRQRLSPWQHPGTGIREMLSAQSKFEQPPVLRNAFQSASRILQGTADHLGSDRIIVDLVQEKIAPHREQNLRTIACKFEDSLHIIIFSNLNFGSMSWEKKGRRNCRIIAEAILQASAEHLFGLPHDHAVLARTLLCKDPPSYSAPLPESVKYCIETSTVGASAILEAYARDSLRYSLFGIDAELQWDNEPASIRHFLLKRLQGQYMEATAEQAAWIRSRYPQEQSSSMEEILSRCELGAQQANSVKLLYGDMSVFSDCNPPQPSFEQRCEEGLFGSYRQSPEDRPRRLRSIRQAWSHFNHQVSACIKFVILSLTADPEYQRELDFVLKGKPAVLRWPVTFLLNGIWTMCKSLQQLVFPIVLFHKRKHISTLNNNMKNMKTTMHKSRTVIDSLKGPSTCFVRHETDGSISVSQYNGHLDSEPGENKALASINTYTKGMILKQRQEFKNKASVNEYEYEYDSRSNSKLPIQRRCIKGAKEGEVVQYDDRGYITTGSYLEGVNKVDFEFWYRKNARFEDELLRGQFIFPHITIRVNWSMPPRKHVSRLEEWVPHTTVTEATFIQGGDVYHTSWGFDHKFETEMSTTLNGNFVDTPDFIANDWFHILKKPSRCAFLSDNPLLAFSSTKSNIFSRALGWNVKRYAVPTSQARTQLWKAWKSRKDIDAITARWMEDNLLRADSILRPYWRKRDIGLLNAATRYIDTQADTIMARVDMDSDTSSWVHIAYKIADLYSFGQGGDTTINTRTSETQLRDTANQLHILAMDTSTFPMEPGGVSACRRDMVNDLKTIRWHLMAESANDYGVPRFQIERNIQSLTILPLWGLDFLNPTHGLMVNYLDSAVVERSQATIDADIAMYFVPILSSLVKISRRRHFSRHDMEEATRALVDLNSYFESSRNWNDVWSSDIVKQAWRELWLSEQEDSLNIQDWWDFEKPTMMQMDTALNMWHRYLFIFSIAVPEEIPDVFQASHHFTGATYGILCKVKRNCTLHVWDHCISFREFTTFMSSAVSFDSAFVNSSLMSLGHLSCVLLEHHADVVLPCAAYYNPGWEIELGSAEGLIEHRRTFARKIDPVVNGICNMEKFEPIKTIKTETPTVVMLSHIQFVKDIKNAIMATDFIVNKWGFKDYRLHVYGDMERAAGLSTECQELIASKGLRENCVLKGLGKPDVVLQDAWLFLNSSISEGLPLAMGEAALTGVPVVCTDVGASFCVVTDAVTGKRFSEVVAPNDSESLARAQINVMALTGQWAAYGEDAPGAQVPVLEYPEPRPESVAAIAKRMIDKQEQRRKLGMMGRTNVLKNFSSERYLREHEQMLWIGKYRSSSWIKNGRPTSWRQSRPMSSAASSVYFHTPDDIPKAWMQSGRNSGRNSGTSTPRTPRLTPETWDAYSHKSLTPSTASTLWEKLGGSSSKRGSSHSRRHTPTLSINSPDEERGIPMVTSPFADTPPMPMSPSLVDLAQVRMRPDSLHEPPVGLGIQVKNRPGYPRQPTGA